MRGKRKSHYLQTENSMFFQDVKDVERIGLNSVNQLSIGDFIIDWDSILGRGQFGIVYKGTLNGSNAAFKLLEINGNKRAALVEAQILAQVGFHTNVVNFLGIYGNEIENGETPYAGTNWTPDFVNDLHKGTRLPAPTLTMPSIAKKGQRSTRCQPISQSPIIYNLSTE
ncbi:unnamed protein product [Orchesella dallaii]|uniref:Protein kinase domain-containing protein n=1 Tax=Orchesella dallaii TaxID=48710 RepID=A0ABP1S113_9HEXA